MAVEKQSRRRHSAHPWASSSGPGIPDPSQQEGEARLLRPGRAQKPRGTHIDCQRASCFWSNGELQWGMTQGLMEELGWGVDKRSSTPLYSLFSSKRLRRTGHLNAALTVLILVSEHAHGTLNTAFQQPGGVQDLHLSTDNQAFHFCYLHVKKSQVMAEMRSRHWVQGHSSSPAQVPTTCPCQVP